MEEVYSDTENPAGLASIEKLYRNFDKQNLDNKLTKNYVKLFFFEAKFLQSL